MPEELRVTEKPAEQVQDEVKVSTRKLSYKLQRELDELPGLIETLENDIDFLQEQVAQPSFYDKDYDETRNVLDALSAKQVQLDTAINRWAELEQ